jgi:putative DeoR family transcriptional regulator (stage III sporulation protein D)
MRKLKESATQKRIRLRVKECGSHIAATGDTIRATAAKLGVSKSTIHKDITDRLLEVDKNLYYKVQIKVSKNLQERHIRGGLATILKFRELRHQKQMKNNEVV